MSRPALGDLLGARPAIRPRSGPEILRQAQREIADHAAQMAQISQKQAAAQARLDQARRDFRAWMEERRITK